MLRILFFEDDPLASENRLFRFRLRREFADIEIDTDEIRSVATFEQVIRKREFDIVILDIMAQAPDDFRWTGTDEQVPSAMTGVELLRRCRLGEYGPQCVDIPIFMRTARGESHIRRLCKREGATDYLEAGAQDSELIDAIKDSTSVLV